MTYPLTADKWKDASASGPQHFMGPAIAAGWDPPRPRACIFTYDPTLTAHVRRQTDRFREATNLGGNGAAFVTGPGDALTMISCAGVGPAHCTMELENLHYLGCNTFVSIGIAGALDPTLRIGDLVLLTSALRDDGLSHHYLEPARYATPSESLTNDLRDALRESGTSFVEGATWTTPTPNRHTSREIAEYTAEGVKTVEMEAAALFAVGEALKVDVASAVVVSDEVRPDGVRMDYMQAIPNLLALLDLVTRQGRARD
jgi:uridine phosphorylase